MEVKEYMDYFKRIIQAVNHTKVHLLLTTKNSLKDLRSFKTRE